jgi:N-dimethylarginine dimethylaminohydrolase
MYSVYQHWDPLRVCVVGRSYPPEFYNWIKKPHVRELFERIAIETEEDFQNIISTLERFGVEVLRPDLPIQELVSGKFVPPPMTPRDHCVMIGDVFYNNYGWNPPASLEIFYNSVKDESWPTCKTVDDFKKLPQFIQDECVNLHDMDAYMRPHKIHDFGCYDKIIDQIKSQNNLIKDGIDCRINGAMVSRIGKDLYFATEQYNQDNQNFLKLINQEFTNYRNHIVDTGGHGDGTYCPITPGLIISLTDVLTYKDTFPGWEVVYLPGQSWAKVDDFLALKIKNHGKWWIPGFEYDQDVINTVESWLGHWVGYVEETVFDVNMLIIDPKNVMVFNYNKQVFDALEKYGITPHIVPFRHRYFWDGGIHCVTLDLHREGTMQDYFPERR